MHRLGKECICDSTDNKWKCAQLVCDECQPNPPSPSSAPTLASTPPLIDECPETNPMFSNEEVNCATSLICDYGSESCCGRTSSSVVCECSSDEPSWLCFHTDACMIADCSENCPNQAPVDGEVCDSQLFKGWNAFSDEEDVCGYNRIDCSCDGVPRVEDMPYGEFLH
mmetsp:Transcript_48567/g.72444  ORF Transcript_48567/g.72444 Transcript_48567/m.72444 type:complete len:168 (-) Transcript_48567:142-645(-)